MIKGPYRLSVPITNLIKVFCALQDVKLDFHRNIQVNIHIFNDFPDIKTDENFII